MFLTESNRFTSRDRIDNGLRASIYFVRAAVALAAEQDTSVGVQNRLQIAATQLGQVKELMSRGSSSTLSFNSAHVYSASGVFVIGPADAWSSASIAAALAPGSLGSITGDAAVSPLALQTAAVTPAANGSPPYELSGVSVTVGGKAARLYAVSPTQINFYVPAGLASGVAEVIVTSQDGYVSRGTTTIAPIAPAIFTVGQNGTGEGSILNATTFTRGTFDVITPGALHPDKNTRLMIFATGFSNAVANTNLNNDVSTPDGVILNVAESVAVEARARDGRLFNLAVEFAGKQDKVIGLDQVIAVLPSALRGAGNVELTLVVGSQRSNSVTVSIR